MNGLLWRSVTRWRLTLAALALSGLWAMLSAEAIAAPADAALEWNALTSAQRQALKPLEHDWQTIEPARRQKWVDLASRFNGMTPQERDRVQQRMTDWVRMTPAQRNAARLNYQDAKRLSPADKQARWNAYNALPDDQRRGLAARARDEAASTTAHGAQRHVPDRPGKLNTVPSAAAATAAPKTVAPALVQAKPGATTNSLTNRPQAPPHQQAGLPKVAATPEFVDARTLLPQRGPQGDGTRRAP